MSFRNALVIAVVLLLSGGATAAAAKDQSIKVSASERAACMPDARRLCRDALPNVYKVLVCFRSQRAKISSGCNAVLASYGF
jgi:hypothetical protein